MLTYSDFVRLDAGEFWQRGELKAGRQVHVSGFAIQRAPVTVKQYKDFLRQTAWDPQGRIEEYDEGWRSGPTFQDANSLGEDFAVVGVSYHDALDFADWVSEAGVACRLPTEAEFEFAVRAGVYAEPDSRDCPHVDVARSHRNGAGAGRRLPIGQGSNCFGISDLTGTIWQWCSDWYAPLADAPQIDPSGPSHQPFETLWRGVPHAAGRVIRGGSFSYPPEYSDCSHRHYSVGTDRNVNLGFRLVLSLEP